ncbi:MAG: hypothetical protein V1729_02795 [Candidatus Woesearchaeota archaeon]
MGIFGFLKKPKGDTTDVGMELPPVPMIEGTEGFPEMNTQDIPSFTDNSLPPLPTDVPGAVPPRPEEQELDTPRMDIPANQYRMPRATPKRVIPDMPPAPDDQYGMEGIPEIPEEGEPVPPPPRGAQAMRMQDVPEMPTQAEFPAMPDMHTYDSIPDKIPPLEDLPDAPSYIPPTPKERLDTVVDNLEAEPEGLPPMYHDEDMPSSSEFPETPIKKMRKVLRGPAYLKTESFKSILNDIENIGTRAGEVDEMIFRLNDFKNGQDQCLEEFKQTIEDVQRKLLFMDKLLFDTNR